MKLLTVQELRQIALNKQHFGNNDILFACEDGSMYVKEDDAKAHCLHKKVKYHMGITYYPISKEGKSKEEKVQDDTAKKLIEEQEFKKLQEEEDAKKADKK